MRQEECKETQWLEARPEGGERTATPFECKPILLWSLREAYSIYFLKNYFNISGKTNLSVNFVHKLTQSARLEIFV